MMQTFAPNQLHLFENFQIQLRCWSSLSSSTRLGELILLDRVCAETFLLLVWHFLSDEEKCRRLKNELSKA